MFFAPPEVKSLSRYSEFGAHLGPKSFGVMLGIAVFFHAVIITAYAMRPHEKVIKIPVRVLNINLGSQATDFAPREEQPTINAGQPVMENSAPVEIKAKSAEQQLEEELFGSGTKSHGGGSSKVLAPKATKSKKHETPKPAKPEIDASTPKRFVRETPPHAATAEAKPTSQFQPSPVQIAANAKPEEIVQRYEQAISLWIGKNKVYPDEAKRNHVEGDAVVRVRINRQGRILYYVIEKSSGNAFIDRAVMNMVRISDPVPAVPEHYPEGDEFEFLVPVSFRLEK